MTEYELINLFYVCNEAITTLIMNFVAILSGYLIASHYLGRQITIIQFIIMTTVYSISMLITIYAAYERMQEAVMLTNAIREVEGLWEPDFQQNSANVIVLSAFFLSFVGSVYFAFASRFRKNINT